MKNLYKKLLSFVLFSIPATSCLYSQQLISNVEGRHYQSLNGKWQVIIDPFDAGAGNWNDGYRGDGCAPSAEKTDPFPRGAVNTCPPSLSETRNQGRSSVFNFIDR